ncbi:MAG: lipoprotein [Cetobacterium sp.]
MKKIFLIIFSILILSACSSKNINNREDTFFNFVILNKNNREIKKNNQSFESWNNLDSDSFPGLRLIKWIESE